MRAESTVFIVDDDDGVRESIAALVHAMGLSSEQFDSGRAFLEWFDDSRAGCVLLDVRLPHHSGLDVQRRLNEAACAPPVIMMSGHADVSVAVRAMKAGAIDFLSKPFAEQALWDAIQRAVEIDTASRARLATRDAVETRLRALSDKECEVLELLSEGMLNKQIAARLNVSVRTVGLRRSAILKKMEVRSIRQLLQELIHARTCSDSAPASGSEVSLWRRRVPPPHAPRPRRELFGTGRDFPRAAAD
jgi:FixJ family two-component response regulator